ncbi:hypothetical protein ACE1AT_20660 [Pelatocladus sp. BLCC-F211]
MVLYEPLGIRYRSCVVLNYQELVRSPHRRDNRTNSLDFLSLLLI